MKKTLFLFFILLHSLFAMKTEASVGVHSSRDISTYALDKQQIVYICTGKYAYAFHSRSNCSGLNNCTASIVTVNQYDAENNYKRRPCCICWSNVYNNCIDDNISNTSNRGSGGGGGNADALTIILLTVIGVEISDEFYLHTFGSFKTNSNYNYDSKEVGYSFGFKRNLKNGSLEYGLRIMNYLKTDAFNYTTKKEDLGVHFAYAHRIFQNKIPYKFNVYAGPAINYYSNKLGYGIMVGGTYSIFRWLKPELKYELTTNTNQISLGFSFKYRNRN